MEDGARKRKTKIDPLLSELGKLPPQDIIMEKALLGSLLTQNHLIYNSYYLRFFNEDLFYLESHKVICKAIKELMYLKQEYDIIILVNQLRKSDNLEAAGGSFGVSDLTNHYSSNFEYIFFILIELSIRRKIILLTQKLSNDSYELSIDIFDTVAKLKNELFVLDSMLKHDETKKSTDYFSETVDIINNSSESNIGSNFYPIGQPTFDEIITISPNNKSYYVGESGSGKSSFIQSIHIKLLEKYDNIAIDWHTYEDRPQDIIVKYISNKFLVSQKVLKGKTKLTLDDNLKLQIKQLQSKFNKFDITFTHKKKFVDEICEGFVTFCAARPGKFCILIIDNVKDLKDQDTLKGNQTEKDDAIARKIENIYEQTKDYKRNLVILHHLSKEYLGPDNIKTGYRPMKQHVKGSGRYSDDSTQTFLINRPKLHQDLVLQYKGYEDVLDSLFLVECVKNRDGELGVVRYFHDLNYCAFTDLNSLSV